MSTLGTAPRPPFPGGGTLEDFAAELEAPLKTWVACTPADDDVLNHAQAAIAALEHVLRAPMTSPLDTEP